MSTMNVRKLLAAGGLIGVSFLACSARRRARSVATRDVGDNQ
jgi:hypothetical protein